MDFGRASYWFEKAAKAGALKRCPKFRISISDSRTNCFAKIQKRGLRAYYNLYLSESLEELA